MFNKEYNMKYSKKKKIEVEVKDYSVEEIKKMIEELEKIFRDNRETWCGGVGANIDTSINVALRYYSIGSNVIHHLINAVALKYEKEVDSAIMEERNEIGERLKVLLDFTREYQEQIFVHIIEPPYSIEYQRTKRVLERKLKKFLVDEFAQLKTKEAQEKAKEEEKNKQYRKDRREERKDQKASRKKLDGNIRNL